jgi:hypothetical protein
MSGHGSNSADAGAQSDAGANNKNVAWYIADGDLPELDSKAQEIFVKYSHLQPDTVQAHVLKKVSLSQKALRHGGL